MELYGEREENLEVAQRIDDKDVEQLMGQMKVLKLDSVVRDIVRLKMSSLCQRPSRIYASSYQVLLI